MTSFRAPGRVNLMGDHTDYNDGFVLPLALALGCAVAVRPRDDGRVVVHSEHDGDALAAAVVEVLQERGVPPIGVDLDVTSTVPAGSGLASSAAFEVAVARALADTAAIELTDTDLARACQEAERRATGVPCGVMDQLVAAAGVPGEALLIDCRTLGAVPVTVAGGISVTVVHSGVARRLADTPYAARRAHCEEAAQRLGVPALRDATYEDVRDDPVARHVVAENARVAPAAMALAAGDLDTLGEVFTASHAGLRDDFGCSTPELDALVERLVADGAAGARLTGAGWGGCVVAVAEPGRLDHWVAVARHG